MMLAMCRGLRLMSYINGIGGRLYYESHFPEKKAKTQR